MLNTTNSNSEYLHNYIRKVAKQEQESVDISSVYTGTIEAAQSGIYTIVLNQSDNSSSVLAIPIVSGDVYDKDDSIYLLRANTTATVNYFIVGKVNAIQEAFFNLTELERFNPNESKADLSFGDNDFISISENINNIFDSINELGYFQLEVKIASKVEDDAKIIIYLNYVEDEGQYAAKFEFSSYEFIGQPGGDNYTLIQKKIFHLPSSIDIENIRIEKVGDFSVAAMNIVAGSLLEVSAAYQNDIVVQNDRNYFEKEIPNVSNPLNTVTLTSKIYYNNKPLVGDALQYYWFLKDDSAVNPESSDYLDIEGAGNGWRCLNIFTLVTTADEQEIRLWDNKNNFIVLNKKNFIVPNDPNEFVNFSNFVNKVKCIVKYFDNFIESDLIDIYNYDYEQFSATLTTNVDPIVIINREDSILLECKVTNNNSKIDLNNFVYKYEWHLGDTVLSNLKDDLIKVQDKSSTSLEEEDIQENVREMENDIEEYYCKVSIYHKNDVIDGEIIEGKQPISEEISNTIQVTSAAAATDIQEEVQYKYYIADNHSVTFEENIQASEDTELSEWSGDWDIYDSNVDSPTWSEGSFDKVFNDLDLFSNKDKTKEYFIYYTKRTIVRQGLEILRKETGSFPQIARSVIYVNNGWKNHRVGDNVNQLNTFNQLTKNGEDDGIYYAEIPELTIDDEPRWGTTYYKRIATDNNIEYEPIALKETISFKETETYYIPNEDGSYSIVDKSAGYDSNIDYYKKINDTEYQKLIVNTQNFDIEVDWPDGENGPFYENIDNKLFINATYIRSGTLEVKDKFYASIDQGDVRIAGFNVSDTTLESKNGTIGLNSDNSDLNNTAIWAGTKNGDKYPFQVTHEGELNATKANIEGAIRATELYIGNSQTSLIQANSNILGFNSADFYINSDHLKLNYNEGYNKGHFEIDTVPLKLIYQDINDYSLMIDTDNLKYNVDGNNSLEITGKITATSGKIGGCTISEDGSITSANGNFKVNAEGNLTADDANIMGTITAKHGEIGGLSIGNGIQGQQGSFSLTSDGLIINSSLAKIQVGNYQTYYDTNNNYTYWQTNGPLKISGMESDSVITSLELLTESGGTSQSITISLEYRAPRGRYTYFYYRLKASPAPRFSPLSFSIVSEGSGSNGVYTFTIPVNGTVSEVRYHGDVALGRTVYFSDASDKKVLLSASYDDKEGDFKTSGLSRTENQSNFKNNILIMGNLVPKVNGSYNLGRDSDRWQYIYAKTGNFSDNLFVKNAAVLTSDRNAKDNIERIPLIYEIFFDALSPVRFKFKENQSDRYHMGFIAQDVKQAIEQTGLTTKDFATYCEWIKEDGTISCGLRYEEFIALCVDQIQKLKKQSKQQEECINNLENKIKEIKGE